MGPHQEKIRTTRDVTPLDAAKFKPLEGGPSFTHRHRALRAVWGVTWLLLASWTLPMMHPWRRLLLRLFGARMGFKSDVRGSAKVWYPPNLEMQDHAILAEGVDCYNMAPVSIGLRSIVSQRAFLCAGTHDIHDPNWQLIARPIIIQEYCWVAAEAFVGPGVTLGRGTVLGARCVAMRDCESWTVYAGNPAKIVGKRQEFRLETDMREAP